MEYESLLISFTDKKTAALWGEINSGTQLIILGARFQNYGVCLNRSHT